MRTCLVLAAFAFLFATGCSTTVVENDGDEVEENDGEAHDADSGDVWDGTRWVVIGGGHRHHNGCGHHFHHGVWNHHPANHVFVGNHHHFRVRVVHRRRRH
ncbi:MAG: hypothetical protein AAB074_11200 [Planctomycetota bacterium]